MSRRTLLLPVDPSDRHSAASQASLAEAARILQAGGTVAFPTETVYGLGANALNEEAVRKIFEAKQRPDWDPLIVHVAQQGALASVAAAVSQADQALIDVFWPGPLTLLLSKAVVVPDIVTAGRPKVGVRMPAHPVARRLIEQTDLPIAAPSANSFGRTSPTTAQHVLEDLDGRIDAIVDGGATNLGLESTVIDANVMQPTIYRPGMISIEQLRAVLPDVVSFQPVTIQTTGSQRQGLPAPGVGLRHYAPRAQLILVEVSELAVNLAEAIGADGLTGVLLPKGFAVPRSERLVVFPWGEWSDLGALAQRLFLGLRELDQQGVQRIVCPIPSADGLGAALRDRLEKAAKPR